MRGFFRRALEWLSCAVGLHPWGPPTDPLPGGAWDRPYQECLRCGAETRPMWAIMDDTYLREQRLYRKLHGPKDWSPRSRR
jgi:hypothetical protein